MTVLPLVACMLATGQPLIASPSTRPSVTIEDCLVSAINDAVVPARRPGVLDRLEVREGAEIHAGAMLGQINELESRLRLDIAQREYDAALKEASDDVNERFAQAAAQVAEAEYDAALEANQKARGAVPRNRERRLRFEVDRSDLNVEKVQLEEDVKRLQVAVRRAELNAAEADVGMHTIAAPFAGVVTRIERSIGEWLRAGDPVCRVVQMDQLRVEGFVDAEQFTPEDVDGRAVTIVAQLPRGREEKFEGRIDYASPTVESSGEFRILARVANRQSGERWVLRPGLTVHMVVWLDSP